MYWISQDHWGSLENHMEQTEFKALLVEEINGTYQRAIKTKRVSDLPEGDLLIRVHYSSLNYKDALSANGNKGVTRIYPHTPGIDAVGRPRRAQVGVAAAVFHPAEQ